MRFFQPIRFSTGDKDIDLEFWGEKEEVDGKCSVGCQELPIKSPTPTPCATFFTGVATPLGIGFLAVFPVISTILKNF